MRSNVGPVIVLGVFDGVHRGHQQLILQAGELADSLGTGVVAVTFHPHPQALIRPDRAPLMLCTVEERCSLLLGAGAQAVEVLAFTRALSVMSPAEFVHVLNDRLHPSAIVVGPNFYFGKDAAGDTRELRVLAAKLGISVHVAALASDTAPWSSSRVRKALADGQVDQAAEVLGRWYRLTAPVVRGDQRGRTLGYPTANLDVDHDLAIPAEGVYAGWLLVHGQQLPSAISIGVNPQFEGTSLRVEAYAIDQGPLDLYGHLVSVDFVARLRGQQVFDTVDALIGQIDQDVADARFVLNGQVQ